MAETFIFNPVRTKKSGRSRSMPPWVIEAGASILAEIGIDDPGGELVQRIHCAMMDAVVTQEWLRSLLHYDPDTGLFTWLQQLSYRAPIGSNAGSLKPSGYVLIEIVRRRYTAHQLAWLYMTGAWPVKKIDHRDTNRSNNKWENLREATNVQNSANARCPSTNLLGLKGVSRIMDTRPRRRSKPFFARIKIGNKIVHLGTFATAEEAHQAYCAAAKAAHGEFAYGE